MLSEDINPVSIKEEEEEKKKEEEKRNKKKIFVIISLCILLIAAGLIIFFVLKKEKSSNTVIPSITDKIRNLGQEGIVLLKNENNILPIDKKLTISVFGRISYQLFLCGHGSGGNVKIEYKKNLIDGLNANKFKLNEKLIKDYTDWINNPAQKINDSMWEWPISYPEKELEETEVKEAANNSDIAIVTIGRILGEGLDNSKEKGNYYLNDTEIKLIEFVVKYFNKIILIINTGSPFDMEFLNNYSKIDGILMDFYGGMEGGNSLGDILSGKANPSGKLPMTIAKKYEYYPSANSWGNKDYNYYDENIYVGYRYFITFNKDKILFPFGFGLSYSTFDYSYEVMNNNLIFNFSITVTNKGPYEGKEVVQIYLRQPSDENIDNPLKILCGFGKTKLLKVNEKQEILITVNLENFTNYDEDESAYVLIKGTYSFELIKNSLESNIIYNYLLRERKRIKKVDRHLCFIEDKILENFTYITNNNGEILKKAAISFNNSLDKEILKNIPIEIPIKEDNISFNDVLTNKINIDKFISSLKIEYLDNLTHGEGGLNSSRGVSGNSAVMGGVTDELVNRGIPTLSLHNGPSGIEMDFNSFLLPSGAALAASFNLKDVEELYMEISKEAIKNKIDVILGPGLNILRNPLNGRNFEYFSEDPFLSGMMAAASIKGIQSEKRVAACPKHFAGNNQEYNRLFTDDIVTERALREIYLKSFEIMVKESKPKSIMTSFNKINGIWSYYNYELATSLLRNEWEFNGVVMTDWYINMGDSREFPDVKNDAYRIRSQVDVLMPGVCGSDNSTDRNIQESIASNIIQLAELQRSAKNVLNLIYMLRGDN